MNRGRLLNSWPIILSCLMTLIPIAILIFIVITLFQKSWTAIDIVGIREFFSTEFAYGSNFRGLGTYGLLGAVLGTFKAVAVSIIIALPVSLSLALLSSEFRLGFLSKSIRGVLGVLSGIPPIIYAFMALFYITTLFMLPTQPKLSTLTGGIILALLVIPFMAPMIDDAIRNVPPEFKEGSHALGANRWYTLRKITLPMASPGIVAATGLGILKAMGDVMIAVFIIGPNPFAADPVWDIVGPYGTLSSTGTQLAGGVQSFADVPAYTIKGLEFSVAFVTALILLVCAFIVLGLVTLLQKRLQERYSR